MRIVPLYWAMTALVAMLLYVAADLVNNSRFTLELVCAVAVVHPARKPRLARLDNPDAQARLDAQLRGVLLCLLRRFNRLGPSLADHARWPAWFAALIALKALLSPDWAPLLFWADSIVFEFILGCVIGDRCSYARR